MTNIMVTDYSADPRGEKDSTAAVRMALLEAGNHREPSVIEFPKGEYHFYKDSAMEKELYTSNTSTMEYPIKWVSILVENQQDMVLEGNGSVLIFHGDVMALAVIQSRNITLRNLSIDYQDPDTVDIRVIEHGVAAGGDYTDFFVPSNYKYEISEDGTHITWMGDVSEKTGKPYWTATDTMDAFLVIYKGYDGTVRRHEERGEDGRKCSDPFRGVTSIEVRENNVLRFHYEGSHPDNQEPGNVFLLCDSRTRKTAGIFYWESQNLDVINVNVHYLSGFGWLIQMCENIRFTKTNFVPREKNGKMTTSNADQIHVAGTKGYVEVEGCNFMVPHDDPINIHGTYMRVEEVLNARTLRLRYIHEQQGGFRQFHEGDKVLFYNRTTLCVPEGMTEELPVIVACSYAPGERYEDKWLDRRTEIVVLAEGLDEKVVQELKQTAQVEGEGKSHEEGLYVAENITYAPEVVVRGCTFTSIPTRGILCSTSRPVVIEDNEFRNISMACIYLSNDAHLWYESGPIRNMLIRRNKFYVRSSRQVEWSDAPAIFIDPVLMPSQHDDRTVHKNIQIEDNEFFLMDDKAVIAKNVEGIQIHNNRIIANQKKLTEELFQFENCMEVSLIGNKYEEE